MKFRQLEFKSLLPKLKVLSSYLIIALIAFEIRGLMLYNPIIIPYEWSMKLTEFLISQTRLGSSMLPTNKCEDINSVVRIMGESFPSHSYGQSEFFGYYSQDPLYQLESVIERGVAYDETGIIKWRYKDNEPYIAFELAGNWTNYYSNNKEQVVSIQQISDSIPSFREKMEQNGFIFSEPNNIPLYQYPHGSFARKIGFYKDNYLYHFTVIEEELPYDPESPEEGFSPDIQKPIRIAMNCAENSQELRSMYEQYLSIPHQFTNETSIVYSGKKDNLARFSVYFPGGVIDQWTNEFYDTRQYPMKLVAEVDNLSNCSVFEVLKIGKDYPCYRPEKNEFDVVSY